MGVTRVLPPGLGAGASADLAGEAGRTPLMISAIHAHADCVRLLLGAGAAVDLIGTDIGFTPLYIACQEGQLECVRLLLEASAAVNQAKDGATPLLAACGTTPTKEGHIDCVRLLLSAGAAVDLQDDVGVSPLYVAAQEDQTDCAQLLLGAGAALLGEGAAVLVLEELEMARARGARHRAAVG